MTCTSTKEGTWRGVLIKQVGELVPVLFLVSSGTFMLAALVPRGLAVTILGEGQPPKGVISA